MCIPRRRRDDPEIGDGGDGDGPAVGNCDGADVAVRSRAELRATTVVVAAVVLRPCWIETSSMDSVAASTSTSSTLARTDATPSGRRMPPASSRRTTTVPVIIAARLQTTPS
jgi:hypothetical protein